MEFETPLTEGLLLRRYKRFLADADIAGIGVTTAHCPNPGSMLSLIEQDGRPQRAWFSHTSNPRRKLPWTLELLDVRGVPVCVNTQRPNRIVEAGIADGAIAGFSGYDAVRREAPYGDNSRIDLLLRATGRPDCFVEVKSATMSRTPGLIEFPDSVSKRGARHLAELARVAQNGARAVMLYLSPRPDGRRFRLAADIDPAFAEAFTIARDSGVEAMCYSCLVSATGIYPAEPISLKMN